MSECRRFIITGKVQGVYFRAHTQKQAKSLHLTGYAVNLVNGNVEVVACGELTQLDELEKWLWQGSPSSRVDDVKTESIDFQLFENFTTGEK